MFIILVNLHLDTDDCDECKRTLDDLENIDTETDKNGIAFVKTSSSRIAMEYGTKHFPSLIYFEKGSPSVYEGDLAAEEDVLQWLIRQKNEDTIESVNRDMLQQLVETSHYLVAFFCELLQMLHFLSSPCLTSSLSCHNPFTHTTTSQHDSRFSFDLFFNTCLSSKSNNPLVVSVS